MRDGAGARVVLLLKEEEAEAALEVLTDYLETIRYPDPRSRSVARALDKLHRAGQMSGGNYKRIRVEAPTALRILEQIEEEQ